MRHERNAAIATFTRIFEGLQTFITSTKPIATGDTVLLREVTAAHTTSNPDFTGRKHEFWVGYVQEAREGFIVSITEVE